jgi:hypothetical protein
MKRRGATWIVVVGISLAALPAAGFTIFRNLAKAPVLEISVDTFTNSTSQHATEVEPSILAVGDTVVALAQAGRFYDGGASDISFATSTDGGKKWTYGYLPGITNIQNPANPWDRVSDPAVAYDAKHGLWLAATLPLTGTTGQMPLVSSSTDGLHWNAPVEIGANNGDFMDKEWIACDDGASSPYYGNCYVEWDDNSLGDELMMTTSSDGGNTWSAGQTVGAGSQTAYGLGGQPVVQPNGNVVVPYLPENGTIGAFSSSNGGASWGNNVAAAPENDHAVAGGLRELPLPSARVDAAGNVYVVWADCSFRTSCRENDIVMITSPDGINWTSPARVPIDAVTSTVDHFIPGIAIAPGTSGSSAEIGIAYYYYPQANCTSATCKLTLGYIASSDGGSTWTAPVQLGAPADLAWLASTDQGVMVGDYIASTYTSHGVQIAAAAAKAKQIGGKFDEYLVTNKKTIDENSGERFTSRGERPIPGVRSDHAPRRYPPTD